MSSLAHQASVLDKTSASLGGPETSGGAFGSRKLKSKPGSNQHKKSGCLSTPMTGRMCSEIHIFPVLCRKSPKIPMPCPLAENGMAGVTHEATRRSSLLLAGCFSTTVCWNRLWTQQGRQSISVIVILNVQGLHGMIAASRLYLHSLKVVCVPKMALCPSALTI